MQSTPPPDSNPISSAEGKRNRTPLVFSALGVIAVAVAATWLFTRSDAGDELVSYTTTFTESCASTGTYEDGYEVYKCAETSPDPRWAGTATLWYSSTGNRFELANEGGTWAGTSGAVGGGLYRGSGLGSGGYEGLQYTYEGRLPTFTVTVEPIP